MKSLLLSLIICLLVFIPSSLFGLIDKSSDRLVVNTVEEEIVIYYMFKVGDKVIFIESGELDRIMKMDMDELREYKKNVLDKRPHQPRGVTP